MSWVRCNSPMGGSHEAHCEGIDCNISVINWTGSKNCPLPSILSTKESYGRVNKNTPQRRGGEERRGGKERGNCHPQY